MHIVCPYTGKKIPVTLTMGEYQKGGIALQLWCEEGPYSTLTVWLPGNLAKDEAYIDINNTPFAHFFMRKYGIGIHTRHTKSSGWFIYPAYKLNLERIKFLIEHPEWEPDDEDEKVMTND